MLEFITSYWFVTLPSILTAFYLLRTLKKAQESKTATERVPVTIESSPSQGTHK